MSLILILAVLFSPAVTGPANPDPVAEAIRLQIEAAGQPAILSYGDEAIHASQSLPGFYERRGFAPVWSSRGHFEQRARRLVETLVAVRDHGLIPANYHLDLLNRWLATGATDPQRLAETDILLTDAFLILGAHLVSGRVDPATFEPEWIATRREVDLVALLRRVASGEDPRRVLDELHPDHPGYGRLVDALARYRTLAQKGGWPRLPPGPAIKPGMNDPAVEVLRRRLSISGDHADGEPADPSLYDDALAEAVVRFQGRFGLEPDGVVGPKTRDALNTSAAERVRQIELNLERWRWIPRDLGERHVLVNVPGFSLHVSESGVQVLTMRVIVGRAMRRTPVFSDVIRYLVFSPSWEVPPTILRQDKLPEIRKNPGYAAEQNMRVFELRSDSWTEVDPLTVDWSRATGKTIRLRQRPGPNNALGGVKFMFPNAFSVYLHDTPGRELFARTQRDFSSGCIRVEQPAELALYLLRDDPAWTAATVRAAMESGQERTVRLPGPVPVHILYWTAWADDDGSVAFRNDIYQRDGRLDAALRLPPPGDEKD